MNRIETVTTTARPIRKLFIIDDHDINQLVEIIRLVSDEIAGITNIILPYTPKLFEDNLTRFVTQHDPDIILNYSKADTALLATHFHVSAFSAPSLDEVRPMASTSLRIWDHLPAFFASALSDKRSEIYSVVDEGGQINLFDALHFGIIPPDLADSLEHSIFQNLSFANIVNENRSLYIHDHNRNFNCISLGLSMGIGGGSSIYEKNNNQGGLFDNKPTIVLGSNQDLASMLYFWNARASYPFNRTLWLPIEVIGIIPLDLQEYTHIAVIDPGIMHSSAAMPLLEDKRLIDSSLYYFPLHTNRWLSFEHTAAATVINGHVKIDHPSDKLFSRNGVNMDIALEVSGLEETLAPPSATVGRLFVSPDQLNPLGFSRIGLRGLTFRVRQFELFRDAPLHEDIDLPNNDSVLESLLCERGFSIEKTRTSASIEQLRRLLGGFGNAALLAHEATRGLLRLLAPKRTKRIVDEMRTAGLSLDIHTERELANRLSTIPSLSQPLTQTISQLEGSLQIKKEDKKNFYSLLQELYDRGFLLRGKTVQCSHCTTRLWYPLESLARPLLCYCCNSAVSLPVAPSTNADDSYRLNELLVQAVDQGLVAVLLTMRVLWEQRLFGRRLLASLMVHPNNSPNPTSEVDILFTLGSDLGVCEVKTEQNFDLNQADQLLDLADQIGANLTVFSTLRERTAGTVEELFQHVQKKELRRPVIILTHDALTASEVPRLSEVYKAKYLRQRGEAVFVI